MKKENLPYTWFQSPHNVSINPALNVYHRLTHSLIPSTRIIRWEAGNCRFGDRCNFAHGDDELRDLPARPPKPLSSSGRGRGRGRGGPPPSYRDSAIGADNGANGSRDGDQQHSIWVASGRPIKGPNNWTQYTSDTGEKYYHHSVTNETQWEAPPGWNGPV